MCRAIVGLGAALVGAVDAVSAVHGAVGAVGEAVLLSWV